MNINNFAIGVDIESILRFKRLNKKKDECFLNKIFTRKEIRYCFTKKNFAPHLAVRFAAKEAIIKAISSLGEKKLAYNKIEIENKADGTPFINLKKYHVKISLSHSEDKAIAFVIVEKKAR